ncbi:acetyl-CoA synthetase-like protein [Daldinia caldariorum]|uniref:acetyl-CoA synthetase-like protein n=1 Tax=Daldinia caldariorum TaxID=326644 RepID=UPI002008B4B6|nr:acetyl-CoA synthetase-like protein [Daldinia caldariorum]KAI1469036.1 acetyl-CoA synthetase-like protein [Daldinia caldariorum]
MKSTFPSSLLKTFGEAPDVPAFEYGPRVVKRSEVLDLVARYTGGLRALRANLELGDSIAIYTGVTPDGFAVQIAAHVLGLRVVSLKPGISTAQLSRIVADTKILIVDEVTRSEIESSLSIAPEVVGLGNLLGDASDITPQGRLEDTALVLFTSGTTGDPKGVEFSYAALTEIWTWQRSAWDADTELMGARYGRFLLFGTLGSVVVLQQLGLCLISGGTAVIPTTPFPLLKFPHVLSDLRISAVLFTVPRLHRVLDILKTDASRFDLSHLRSVFVSGSPVPSRKLREAIEVLGDVVFNGYGTSETNLLCLLSAADTKEHPDAINTVGRPFAGVQIQIRSDSGDILPLNTIGHVWVKSPGSFSGYTNEESASVLDPNGWIWTRDLGSLDDRGFLHLTGRARDIVIINANVYYNGAIENALSSHPDVDAAYVVSIPDDKTGEAAAAFITTTAKERGPDLDALRELVKEKVSPAAVPSVITVIDSVPIAPSGKPDKQALIGLISKDT